MHELGHLRRMVLEGELPGRAEGLREAGMVNVQQGTVPGAGHFTAEEAPEETWDLISKFAHL